jgi:hypothetical protein
MKKYDYSIVPSIFRQMETERVCSRKGCNKKISMVKEGLYIGYGGWVCSPNCAELHILKITGKI